MPEIDEERVETPGGSPTVFTGPVDERGWQHPTPRCPSCGTALRDHPGSFGDCADPWHAATPEGSDDIDPNQPPLRLGGHVTEEGPVIQKGTQTRPGGKGRPIPRTPENETDAQTMSEQGFGDR